MFFTPIFALLIQAIISSWFNLKSPFWLDETYTGAMSCQPTYYDVLNIIAGDTHPVTFALWVHSIFNLFGCNLTVIRISNAIILVSTGIIYSLLLQRKFGILSALIFNTLFFGSSFIWYYAYEARAYPLLTATTILVLYTIINNKWNLGLIATILGASLHYFGAYLFVIQLVIFISLYHRINIPSSITLLFALILISLLYFYSLQLTTTNINSTDSWFSPPSFVSIFFVPVVLLGSFQQYILGISTFIIFFRAIKLLNWLERNLTINCLLLAIIFIIGLFIISLHKPMFVPRYMMFLSPLLFTPISIFLPKITNNYFCNKYGSMQSIQILTFSMTIYVCFGIISTLQSGKYYRLEHWNNAAQYSICSKRTCGFILDMDFQAYMTSSQYNALANFLLRTNGTTDISWTAIYSKDIENWLSNHRDTPLIYVKSTYAPKKHLNDLISKFNLHCTTSEIQPSVFLCQR